MTGLSANKTRLLSEQTAEFARNRHAYDRHITLIASSLADRVHASGRTLLFKTRRLSLAPGAPNYINDRVLGDGAVRRMASVYQAIEIEAARAITQKKRRVESAQRGSRRADSVSQHQLFTIKRIFFGGILGGMVAPSKNKALILLRYYC